MEPSPTQSNSPTVPIAIIVGFAMIAIAIFFTSNSSNEPTKAVTPSPQASEEDTVSSSGPRLVDDTDYIRGNPNAPILLIEYSDYDCPFCKQFHDTMNQIMDEFGVDGRVAWVYRQFPLEQLHPNAPRISEAALCVGEIGGNTAFWQFTDLIFEQRELKAQTNMVKLPDYAERVGVDRSAYTTCMQGRQMQESVTSSLKDGFDTGIRGTPYTFVVAGNQQAVINGARSYETVRGIVTTLVDQLDGNFDPEAIPVSELPIESE